MGKFRTMYLMKEDALIGTCVETSDGWRFFPNTAAHKASRKAWPTAVNCIPTWAMNQATDFLTRFEWEPFGADRKSDVAEIVR